MLTLWSTSILFVVVLGGLVWHEVKRRKIDHANDCEIKQSVSEVSQVAHRLQVRSASRPPRTAPKR